MASPLTLRVNVDMGELVKGAQKAGSEVEDLADSFDDVESSSGDAVKGATTDLDNLGQAASQADTDVEGIGDAAGSVQGALGDLGGAAQQALSGDLSGAVETATGALSGLADMAPGIAGALGGALIGAVGAWITELDLFGAKTQEIKDSVSGDLVELGGAFDAAALASRVRDVVNDTEMWAAANTIAKATGIDLATVVQGLAGDADITADAARRLTDATEQALGGEGLAAGIPVKSLHEAQQALEGVSQGLADGRSKADVAAQAVAGITEEADAANQAIRDAGQSLLQLPTDTESVIRIRVDDSAVKAWSPPKWLTTVTPKLGAPTP